MYRCSRDFGGGGARARTACCDTVTDVCEVDIELLAARRCARADAYYREFGRRLRAARAQRGTQQDLAARVGLSRAAIANIEFGRQRVPLHMIARFAGVLEVQQESLLPPIDLLDGDRNTELQRLSPEDQASVDDVLDTLETKAGADGAA